MSEEQFLILHKKCIEDKIHKLCGCDIPVYFCGKSYLKYSHMGINYPPNYDKNYIYHCYADAVHESFHYIYKTLEILKYCRMIAVTNGFDNALLYSIFSSVEDYRVNTLGLFDYGRDGILVRKALRERAKNELICESLDQILYCELHNFRASQINIRYDVNKMEEAKELAEFVPFIERCHVPKVISNTYKILYGEKDDTM